MMNENPTDKIQPPLLNMQMHGAVLLLVPTKFILYTASNVTKTFLQSGVVDARRRERARLAFSL